MRPLPAVQAAQRAVPSEHCHALCRNLDLPLEPTQTLLAILHSSDPASVVRQLQLGIPGLLDMAETAFHMQCPDAMRAADACLAELCPGSLTADAVAELYLRTVHVPVPAFATACESFIAASAGKPGDLMAGETQLALEQSEEALRKSEAAGRKMADGLRVFKKKFERRLARAEKTMDEMEEAHGMYSDELEEALSDLKELIPLLLEDAKYSF